MSTDDTSPATTEDTDPVIFDDTDPATYAACDLIATQWRLLEAGHQYAEFRQDAINTGRPDVRTFFEDLIQDDAKRVQRCAELLEALMAPPEDGAPNRRRKKYPRPHRRHR